MRYIIFTVWIRGSDGLSTTCSYTTFCYHTYGQGRTHPSGWAWFICPHSMYSTSLKLVWTKCKKQCDVTLAEWFQLFFNWNHSGDEMLVSTLVLRTSVLNMILHGCENIKNNILVQPLLHNFSHFWFKLIPIYELVLVLQSGCIKMDTILFPSCSLDFSTHS